MIGTLVAIVVAATLVVAPGQPPSASAAPRAERIAGADRYATSAAVSRAAYPTPSQVDTVVVASGSSYADAISAGPVAAALGGPVLLVKKSSLPRAVRDEIVRLAPKRIIVAGGTGAISATVARALRELAPEVVRADGANRYDTSIMLIRLAFDAAPTVYVATGGAYPDALSGGALAAFDDAPLLVVPGQKDSVSQAARTLVADLGTTKVTIVGGSQAVSPGIARSLAALDLTVDRLSGTNRYGTSAAVAATFPKGSKHALIASGANFPDALSAVSLAAVRRAPVIVNSPLCARDELRGYVASHAPSTLTTIGGPLAVRGLVGSLAKCESTISSSSRWVLVNKKHPLTPKTYAPTDLRRVAGSAYRLRTEAAGALERMIAAAQKAGAGRIGLASAYRSYSSQKRLYAGYVASKGSAWADIHSARPGHSEHQTGLTADLVACSRAGCGGIYGFAGTAQQKWVQANAWKYGFIVRYEKGYTKITGYTSEPWHLRYVGTTLAADYRAGGFHTLEQYLGYPSARTY